MIKRYGLIGHPLNHSFSKKYFDQKFAKENLVDCRYDLFDIDRIEALATILQQQNDLRGLNVTIPYKESVMQFLDTLDTSAETVGAVNVIKIENGQLTGYNSDFYGFQQSLVNWLAGNPIANALVFGTGGAAKAVCAVLKTMAVPNRLVSRSNDPENITYAELTFSEIISDAQLLINTTPLGTFPNTQASVPIPYEQITAQHFVYDLIYNPEESQFLQKAAQRGAKTKNGLEMLELQAEKAWEIWNA